MPSKKLILVTASIVLVVLLIAIATSYRNKPASSLASQANVKASAGLQDKIVELDADQDGLKDWEEVLWHTNPEKADTDDDGTKDGEEIKQGRNPAKAGPKDALSEQTLSADPTTEKNRAPETITDSVSKDLFTKYVALKLSGTEMTEEDHDLLVTNVLQDVKNKIVGKEYKRENLHIATTESEETLRAYAQNMGSILESNHTSEHELAVLKDYLDTAEADNENPAILNRLDPIIAIYDNTIRQMLALEVPPTLASLHLQLINIASDIQASIRGLKLTNSDSLSALDSLNNYLLFTNQHSDTRAAITKFYDDRGLFFDPQSLGYSFTHFYQ